MATRPAPLAAPHQPRRVDYQRELAPLIVDGERIAHEVARKAALRAETELIERQMLRGRVDAPRERVARLEHRRLRGHEAEHDARARRRVAERPEVAGTL